MLPSESYLSTCFLTCCAGGRLLEFLVRWLLELFAQSEHLLMRIDRNVGKSTDACVQNSPGYSSLFYWFEVLAPVAMKASVLWGTTPCSLLKINRRFGRTRCLHLHDGRISRTRNCSKAIHNIVRLHPVAHRYFTLKNLIVLSTLVTP
jgi:hypothetical protein